jgi:hypothetical protein
VGWVYDPRYGNLVYYYFPSTGYAYFPAFRSGLYVARGGSSGYYPSNGGSPADRWLSGGEWSGRWSSGTIDRSGQGNHVFSLDGKVLTLP